MGSKAFLYLGLLLAIVLLISSEVAAKDLAETATDKAKEDDAKLHPEGGGGYPGQGGYGGYPGQGGHGGYPGQGGHGGYPGQGGYGGYPGHGGHGGRGGYGGYPGRGSYGGGCRYGCCGGSRYGRGCRCCSYAGEAVNANTEAKPQN